MKTDLYWSDFSHLMMRGGTVIFWLWGFIPVYWGSVDGFKAQFSQRAAFLRFYLELQK